MAVDPGSRAAGVAIFDAEAKKFLEFVKINPKAVKSFDERLWEYYQMIAKLARSVEPDLVVVERMYVWKNPKVAIQLGQLVGATKVAAHLVGADVVEMDINVARKTLRQFGNNYTSFGVSEGASKDPDIFAAVQLCLAGCLLS